MFETFLKPITPELLHAASMQYISVVVSHSLVQLHCPTI